MLIFGWWRVCACAADVGAAPVEGDRIDPITKLSIPTMHDRLYGSRLACERRVPRAKWSEVSAGSHGGGERGGAGRTAKRQSARISCSGLLTEDAKSGTACAVRFGVHGSEVAQTEPAGSEVWRVARSWRQEARGPRTRARSRNLGDDQVAEQAGQGSSARHIRSAAEQDGL